MFLVVFDKHLNIEHCFTFGKSSLAILCLSFSPRRLLLCLIWPAGDLKEENIYKKRWNGPFGPKDGPTCQICVFRIRVRRHRRCIIIKLFPKAWTSRFWPPPPQYNLIFMQFVKKKELGHWKSNLTKDFKSSDLQRNVGGRRLRSRPTLQERGHGGCNAFDATTWYWSYYTISS